MWLKKDRMSYDEWKATELEDLELCLCGDEACQGECYEVEYEREEK